MNQFSSVFFLFALILNCIILLSTSIPCHRVQNSPYPCPSSGLNTASTLYTFDSTKLTDTQVWTLQSLQGLLSRSIPGMYQMGDDGKTLWAEQLTIRSHVSFNNSFESDFKGLISVFKEKIDGYVLSKYIDNNGIVEDDRSSALTYAAANGTYDMIVVSIVDESTLSSLGIKRLAIAPTNAELYNFLLANPLGVSTSGNSNNTNNDNALTNRIAILQDPGKFSVGLSDYSAFTRAVSWYDVQGLPSITSQYILGADGGLSSAKNATSSSQILPSAVLGWGVGDEAQNVISISKAGGYIHAADYAMNLATMTAYTSIIPLKQKRDSFIPSSTHRKHSICFVFSDGDNIQWALNSMATSPNWFGSPSRGTVPVGWTMSPAVAELAPTILEYMYDKMVPGTDGILAGPSGTGYYYPNEMNTNQNDMNQNLTAAFMTKSDMRVANVMYSSPSGTSADNCASNGCVDTLLMNENIDGVFMYSYGGFYTFDNGEIVWRVGKPVIGGRYSLAADNITSLIWKLRQLPNDPLDPNSYSVIPTVIWSYSYDDVVTAVNKLLNGNYFEVLTPDNFVSKIQNNVPRPCENVPMYTIVTDNYGTCTCTQSASTCGLLTDCKCRLDNKHSSTTVSNPPFNFLQCPTTTNRNKVTYQLQNCGGRIMCGSETCDSGAYEPPSGNYLTLGATMNLNSCVTFGGFIYGCKYDFIYSDLLPKRNLPVNNGLIFDFYSCPNLAITFCYGAIFCADQDCTAPSEAMQLIYGYGSL